MNNPPVICEQARLTLGSLSRFWTFNRKKLVAELQGHLDHAQSQLDMLFSTNQQLTTLCAGQNDEIGKLKSHNCSLVEALQIKTANLASIVETLAQEKSKLQKNMLELSQAMEYAKDLEEREVQALARIASLEEHLVNHKQQLVDKEQCIQDLQCTLVDTRQQIDLLETYLEEHKNQLLSTKQNIDLLEGLNEQLKISQQYLERSYADISNQHLSLTEKFSLVRKVLAQQPPGNEELARFSDLINHDYMDFAGRESSLAEEAQAVLAMQAILTEMQMLNNFPSIAGKTILSIAGGFSSGKSAFVNSFIRNSSVKLATGINPVTVVPTYVVCSEDTQIEGYSYNGGSIDLELSLYASMCHEYVQAFGFDLRRILPFISVKVPMNPELFGNLCIIDTPGYNPGSTGGAVASDRSTAASLVNQASAMVWVIGLDPAGTIDQSDIEFIESTPFRAESLYIVLNKADVKSQDDILEIMGQIADELSFAGIDYAGMCAYSSTRKKDYPSCGMTLEQFLRSINHKVDTVGKVTSKIDTVFDAYKHAIQADIVQLEDCKGEFNAFKLDALEIGGTELLDRIYRAFPISEKIFDSSELKKLLKESESLRQALKLTAQRVLE